MYALRIGRAFPVTMLVCLSGFRAVSAQAVDIILGQRGSGGFSGRILTPVSTTTVLDMMLESDTLRLGGSLAYVLLIKGPPGWFRVHTEWHDRTDSSGVLTQDWAVGPLKYQIRYDPRQRTFQAFDSVLALASRNALLVSLDSLGAKALEVRPLLRLEWFLPEPGNAAELLFRAFPQLREFAGLPH
jgi:hypothetical protein